MICDALRLNDPQREQMYDVTRFDAMHSQFVLFGLEVYVQQFRVVSHVFKLKGFVLSYILDCFAISVLFAWILI